MNVVCDGANARSVEGVILYEGFTIKSRQNQPGRVVFHATNSSDQTENVVGDLGEHCMICGDELEYLVHAEEFICVLCGKEERGYVWCMQGHYVCDYCHGIDSEFHIKEIVMNSTSINPIEIAEVGMRHPLVPMIGCENAWVASAALMSAIRNEGSFGVTNEDIIEALRRTQRQSIGAFCGLTGICGVTVGIGAAFAVLLGAECPKGRETKANMNIVGKVVQKIADETGPCCCKNFVRIALELAVKELKDILNIQLEITAPQKPCAFVEKHPHGCRREQCRYF